MPHCYHNRQNGQGQCPKCWDKNNGICSGCYREITNKAYFAGAHVKGTCQRDKRIEAIPRPTVFPHPSKAVLNRAYTDKEALQAKYDDWKHETPAGDYLAGTAGRRCTARLPETYSELCQWWHLKPVGA